MSLIIPKHVKEAMDAKKPKQAELVVNVSGPLPGTLVDWPSHIQDKIYEALAKRSLLDKRAYEIVSSRCDVDDGVWYVHVLARAEAEKVQ